MYEDQTVAKRAGIAEISTERPGEVKSEIIRLHADVEELNALVSRLRGKLAPVLRQTPDQVQGALGGPTPEPQPSTEHGVGLRDVSNRVRNTIFEIKDLLTRLEV